MHPLERPRVMRRRMMTGGGRASALAPLARPVCYRGFSSKPMRRAQDEGCRRRRRRLRDRRVVDDERQLRPLGEVARVAGVGPRDPQKPAVVGREPDRRDPRAAGGICGGEDPVAVGCDQLAGIHSVRNLADAERIDRDRLRCHLGCAVTANNERSPSIASPASTRERQMRGDPVGRAGFRSSTRT